MLSVKTIHYDCGYINRQLCWLTSSPILVDSPSSAADVRRLRVYKYVKRLVSFIESWFGSPNLWMVVRLGMIFGHRSMAVPLY